MGDIKKILLATIIVATLLFPLVSAGVGISWDRESALVPEKTKTCLTYKIYNPWPKDSYAQIKLSDELSEIIASQESETQFIPAETSSGEAIPVTFCFKTPVIYERDCLVADKLICKQDCLQDMKVYDGQVEIIELTEEQVMSGGSGGSKTMMSVSAPLKIRVQCVKHDRDWSLVYGLVALIAGIVLAWNIIRHKKIARELSREAKTTVKSRIKKSKK
ncbi:hypothetical protein GW931_00080 [archaeon]|nr:hypothetical protein [archaeon]